MTRARAYDGETYFPTPYQPHHKHLHRRTRPGWSHLILFHIADAIYHLYQVAQDPEDERRNAALADALVILDELAKGPAKFGEQGSVAEGFYLVDPSKAGA